MSKYKVIAGCCAGNGKNGKKVHDSGDIVTQEDLNEPASKLVTEGFLELVVDDVAPVDDSQVTAAPEEEKKSDEEQTNEVKESDDSSEQTAAPEEESAASDKELEDRLVEKTKKEIIVDLNNWGIVFDPKLPAKDLYKIWKANRK